MPENRTKATPSNKARKMAGMSIAHIMCTFSSTDCTFTTVITARVKREAAKKNHICGFLKRVGILFAC
jgi:hypothetical protein